jgi:hypothetical protein
MPIPDANSNRASIQTVMPTIKTICRKKQRDFAGRARQDFKWRLLQIHRALFAPKKTPLLCQLKKRFFRCD